MNISSLEIVGKFPTEDEAEELDVAQTTPVWLSTGTFELSSEIKQKIKIMRKADMKILGVT